MPMNKAILAAALTGMGISAEPGTLVAGLFLALAGATLAAISRPEKDPREWYQTVGAALFVAVLIAFIQPIVLPNWPLIPLMMLGGFLSRYIVGFGHSFGKVAERRGGAVAKTVLKGEDDE